jgi:hypothetical protein
MERIEIVTSKISNKAFDVKLDGEVVKTFIKKDFAEDFATRLSATLGKPMGVQ